MKFILIAAVALLALAHGSYAQEAELEQLSKYFEDMKTKMVAMLQDQDLANQAQTFLNQRRDEMEPLIAQVRDQLTSAASNMHTQTQPLLTNFQEQVEALLKKMTDQAQALAN